MAKKGAEAVERGGAGLHLKVEYPDVYSFLSDYQENICKGGTFVSSHREWTVGDRLRLTLSFPGLLRPIDLPGKVSWARIGKESGVGIEFPFEENPQLKTRIAVNSADGWALHFHRDYEPELYYLPDDPAQADNIVADNEDQAERLHGAFQEFLREIDASDGVRQVCGDWRKA